MSLNIDGEMFVSSVGPTHCYISNDFREMRLAKNGDALSESTNPNPKKED